MKFVKKSAVLFFACLSLVSCAQKTKLNLTVPSAQNLEGEAERSDDFIVKSPSPSGDCYVFTDDQLSQIQIFNAMQGSSALLIDIHVKNAKHAGTTQTGFIYKSDLKSKKSVKKSLSPRPSVSVNLADFSGKTFSLLLSMTRGEELPAGFFIQPAGKTKYSVLSVALVTASAGFDFSGETPLYAFAPNGGNLIKNSKKIDFTGLSMCLPSVNSENSLMPCLKIKLSGTQNAVFTSGGEKITVRNGGQDYLNVPFAALKSPYSEFQVLENENAETDSNVLAVLAVPSDEILLQNSKDFAHSPIQPLKVDPGLIMNWQQKNWRGNDYELFEWDRFEGILFFDTADYEVQNDFFRRLAFFVEKQGYKGRLLTDSQLKNQHGYNAHDYRAYDLARFFEKARAENFPLNDKERLLREILQKNGVIVLTEDGKWSEGRGAVISISQESPAYLRTTFVAHEGWHGIYFVDSGFRDTVASVFYSLQMKDPRALDFLFRYFEVTPSLNYDTKDDYLMKNEFMAYMLQRPVSACGKYFTDMAARNHAQSLIKEEADYILETKAQSFEGAAQMLEDYVNERWNLAAGRVWLLTR